LGILGRKCPNHPKKSSNAEASFNFMLFFYVYFLVLTELPENFLEESEEDHIDEIYASDSAIQFDEQLLQHTMELSNLGSNSYQKMSNLGMRMEEHSIHVAEEFKISIMSVNGLEKTLTGDLIEFYDFYSANLRMECHQKKSWWIDFEGNPSKFHEFSTVMVFFCSFFVLKE
jgi:hypothetical protein